MKVNKGLPKTLNDILKTENEYALLMMDKFNKPSAIIPIHSVRMRLWSDEGDIYEDTILPSLSIYTKIKNDKFSRSGTRYIMSKYNITLPIGHIFSGSGSLCLGNIFVPSTLGTHQIMQPLETLLLYNDRNHYHGGAFLTLDKARLALVQQIVDHYLDGMIDNIYEPNFVKYDTLWRIGAEFLKQYPKQEAYHHMSLIFDTCFSENLDHVKEQFNKEKNNEQ